VILDVMRGSPAIYMTFMGYDEIAHHAGPDSQDALNSLKGFDRALARILDVIDRKAPRPYDVFILSDHGQSYGATFRQRAGYTLGEFLDSIARGRSYVTEISDGDSIRLHVSAVLTEMEGLYGRSGEGRRRADVIGRAGKTIGRRVKPAEHDVPSDTDMLVLVGGNLANVYFPRIVGKVTAVELEQLHPGLLENLVAHPDVGLVVTYTESGLPWVIGKSGARNLADGSITGDLDPLSRYGNAELRARQIRRVAEFPNAGDLIIISNIDDLGHVAAFEELIGSHGGIGGQQTDAFLFHPADLSIPPATTTLDLFSLLNGRRDLTASESEPAVSTEEKDPWSWPVIWSGISDVHGMTRRAARSLRLDRSLFAEVATDPYATGQALLISFLLALGSLVVPLFSRTWQGGGSPTLLAGIVVLLLGLAICLLLATLMGRTVDRKRSFTRAFNAIAYAGVGGFVAWFAPLSNVGPLLLITGILIVLVASWLAIQEALSIPRWPAVLIPLLSFLTAALILIALDVLFLGSVIAA
jgi:hypothetical protein